MATLQMNLDELAVLLRNQTRSLCFIRDVQADGDRLKLTLASGRLHAAVHASIVGCTDGAVQVRLFSPLSLHRLVFRVLPASALPVGLSVCGDVASFDIRGKLPYGIKLRSLGQNKNIVIAEVTVSATP